jgi:outer membrane protein assembly factor BamD
MPEQIDETKSWSASKLYAEAKYELNSGNYKTAIEFYEKLEARYPHGKYAQQAQLEVAYAYFRSEEPESAIAATERFIKLHPKHHYVDYAYYLRGLIVFPERKNIFEYIWPQDESKRDTQASMESFRYFNQLVSRFPSSIYSKDAVQRMRYLKNKVAKHQLHVANFYMKQQAYLAAINRSKEIVQKYQQTPAVEEALLIMVKAYTKLDLPELANDAQKIYDLNKGKFVEDIYLEQQSVIPHLPDWMRPY